MGDPFVEVREGSSPLVLGMPHVGTMLPPEIAAVLNEAGLCVPDTDWWIDKLYDFTDALAPTVVKARLSRYVVDLNRDPSGASLYPGQATTELCPTTNFDGAPIYREGSVPDAAEIARRRAIYFAPFHTALQAAIARAKAAHGYCVLYDCHSIRGIIPRLFEGELPTLNLGSNGGASLAPTLAQAVTAAAERTGFDFVVDGRFKGGFITRHYGDPANGVHALQMELAQRAYMQERAPWTYDEAKATHLATALKQILAALLQAAEEFARKK